MTLTKCYKALMPVVLWIGALVAVAFVLLYVEADLLWKVQQHNVFLSSALFFKQQMVVPGGMLSYLGAFLTQHFYYPWVGVILLCGLWLLLMWLTKRTFNIPGQWMVVTLVPVAILLVANMSLGYWVYVIKLRGYFFVPTLGVIFATALIWAFRKLPEKLWIRAAFIVVATLVGYPLMGVYALAAVILMAILVWRKWLVGVFALVSMIAIPLLYYRFVYYETNLADIYWAGLPVFIVRESHPQYYYSYYALALCYVLLALNVCTNCSCLSSRLSPLTTHLLQLCLLAAVVAGVNHFWYKDANFHHELRMLRCVEQADWEGVIKEGTKQDCEPTRAIVVLHNLALSRLGRQCDEMYSFRKGSSKINTPLPVYMYHVAGRLMLYQYGMMNECHRVCMEDGVEYGWNVDVLQYLARCAILNKETQAARKFLDLLRQTCYYGSWADHMEQLMNNPKLLADDAETGPITHMLHYTDHIDAVEGWIEKCVMTNLAEHDADDLYFQEQAVLGALWTRDASLFWPRFEHYVQLKNNENIPRIFQEAAWMFANLEGQEGLDEWELAPGVKENFYQFMKGMEQLRQQPNNGNVRAFLFNNYGNTYYFEYFFLRNITYY